ncbi:Dual specificity mitogen-activated protein kinase kinase 7, partial [Eudyptes moseleyi]
MAASSLEQKLSRLEAKLKQENREARRRIDLNLDISPARARPTLQLPLVSDGGGRAVLPEGTQHPPPPSRPRNMLGLPQPPFLVPRSVESIEIDQKLQEIMKQTGYLTGSGCGHGTPPAPGSGYGRGPPRVLGAATGPPFPRVWMRPRGSPHLDTAVARSVPCPSRSLCVVSVAPAPAGGVPDVTRIRPFPQALPLPPQTDVFIAMELMGTCAEKLKKRIQGPIPERILGKMTVAIVKALFYLKEKHGVIHRDVKPSNILLDERGQVKLCDFGISGRLVDSKAKTRSAGCAAYMAPERIDPPDPTKPDYDIRADVWSLGISLVELATGQFPYQNCKTDFEVLTKVLQEDPPLLPPAMGFSGDFQAFVRDCLTKDHRKRPKYNKLLEHNFIKRYETLEVDVASWFKDVMAKTESPRTGGGLSQHHLPFFT